MSMTLEEKMVVKFIEVIETLEDLDRMAIFDQLAAKFCMHCGGENPPCRCWDDRVSGGKMPLERFRGLMNGKYGSKETP